MMATIMKPYIIDIIYKKVCDIYDYEIDQHSGYESGIAVQLKNLKKFICELDVNEHPTLELGVEELFSTNDRTNTKRFLTISCKN